MKLQKTDDEAAARRVRNNRLVAAVAALAIVATVFFWFWENRTKRHSLRMSAGDPLSHRHELAEIFRAEARDRGLEIELVPTAGSHQALHKVMRGELDVALVGGERGEPGPEQETLRQVATLVSEPLHLFVRPDLLEQGTSGLRGKRLDLAHPESATHLVARKMLDFIGLHPGADYVESDYSFVELSALADDKLPDGVFALSPLPWKLGTELVQQHGYRLMELPFGDALALRESELHDTVIPAYSYSAVPPVPEKPLHTVAGSMLMVANRQVPRAAIERLLEVLYESDFARLANLPPLDSQRVLRLREFPLHPGTLAYLRRGQPLLNGQVIDNLENLRSFLVSGALAAFLLWRWYSKRQLIGFETYFDAISNLEVDALASERDGQVTTQELRQFRQRLTVIKGEALERHAEGVLTDDEQLVGFLSHVSDVRHCLDGIETRHRPAAATVSSGPVPEQSGTPN